MLHYAEAGLSFREVPNEASLCIYISGCQNNCIDCHYPILNNSEFGDVLSEHYKNLVELYLSQITCVCFLGEGGNTESEHSEFGYMVQHINRLGLKSCLYCGRDTDIECWMHIFDYVKIGSYKAKFGGAVFCFVVTGYYKTKYQLLFDKLFII